jgi:hypothetical protein
MQVFQKNFLDTVAKKIISYIYCIRSRPQELKQHFILWSANKREGETYASQESCEESTCKEGREEGCQEEINSSQRSSPLRAAAD